jgi:hypothetical protein
LIGRNGVVLSLVDYEFKKPILKQKLTSHKSKHTDRKILSQNLKRFLIFIRIIEQRVKLGNVHEKTEQCFGGEQVSHLEDHRGERLSSGKLRK